jgi:hypothetical protein
LKDGPMVPNMKVNTLKAKSMAKENSFGLIKALIMESLQTIIFKELASINGLMEEYTMESGSITKCKVMARSLGQMAGSM